MTGKIALAKFRPPGWLSPDVTLVNLVASLPFYRARRGDRSHLVRSARMQFKSGKYEHTSLSLWCGGVGSLPRRGWLSRAVSEAEPVCATCFGRAIGAGKLGSKTINGQVVVFNTRSDDPVRLYAARKGEGEVC